jgi:hypothetical protein
MEVNKPATSKEVSDALHAAIGKGAVILTIGSKEVDFHFTGIHIEELPNGEPITFVEGYVPDENDEHAHYTLAMSGKDERPATLVKSDDFPEGCRI